MFALGVYGQLESLRSSDTAMFFMATLFAFAGTALMAWRRERVLDRNAEVVRTSRVLLARRFTTSEALEGIRFVSIGLGREQSGEGETTTYPVSLEGHNRRIELDAPGYWEPARNLAEEVARFLDLPLRDPDRSGKLLPEEVDHTVGRRGLDLDPVREPTRLSLRVEQDSDDLLCVRVPSPDHRPFLGLSLIVGLFFLIPLTLELFLPLLAGRPVDLFFVSFVVLLPLWVFFEAARAVLLNGGLLEVTPAALRMTFPRPWGDRVVAIPAGELEDLVILRPEMGGPRSLLGHLTVAVLVARSDRASVRIGYGASREELSWLRSKIVRVVGRRNPDRPPRPRVAAKRRARALGWGGLAAASVLIAVLGIGLGIRPGDLPWPSGVDFDDRRVLIWFFPAAAIANFAGLEVVLLIADRWRRIRERRSTESPP